MSFESALQRCAYTLSKHQELCSKVTTFGVQNLALASYKGLEYGLHSWICEHTHLRLVIFSVSPCHTGRGSDSAFDDRSDPDGDNTPMEIS